MGQRSQDGMNANGNNNYGSNYYLRDIGRNSYTNNRSNSRLRDQVPNRRVSFQQNSMKVSSPPDEELLHEMELLKQDNALLSEMNESQGCTKPKTRHTYVVRMMNPYNGSKPFSNCTNSAVLTDHQSRYIETETQSSQNSNASIEELESSANLACDYYDNVNIETDTLYAPHEGVLGKDSRTCSQPSHARIVPLDTDPSIADNADANDIEETSLTDLIRHIRQALDGDDSDFNAFEIGEMFAKAIERTQDPFLKRDYEELTDPRRRQYFSGPINSGHNSAQRHSSVFNYNNDNISDPFFAGLFNIFDVSKESGITPVAGTVTHWSRKASGCGSPCAGSSASTPVNCVGLTDAARLDVPNPVMLGDGLTLAQWTCHPNVAPRDLDYNSCSFCPICLVCIFENVKEEELLAKVGVTESMCNVPEKSTLPGNMSYCKGRGDICRDELLPSRGLAIGPSEVPHPYCAEGVTLQSETPWMLCSHILSVPSGQSVLDGAYFVDPAFIIPAIGLFASHLHELHFDACIRPFIVCETELLTSNDIKLSIYSPLDISCLNIIQVGPHRSQLGNIRVTTAVGLAATSTFCLSLGDFDPMVGKPRPPTSSKFPGLLTRTPISLADVSQDRCFNFKLSNKNEAQSVGLRSSKLEHLGIRPSSDVHREVSGLIPDQVNILDSSMIEQPDDHSSGGAGKMQGSIPGQVIITEPTLGIPYVSPRGDAVVADCSSHIKFLINSRKPGPTKFLRLDDNRDILGQIRLEPPMYSPGQSFIHPLEMW